MEEFGFKPDDYRYVYLTSLQKETEEFYNIMLERGQRYLSSMNLHTINHVNSNEHFQRAMQILERGIRNEREVEERYFKNLLNQFPKEPVETYKYLEDKLTNIFNAKGSFDYPSLINFLNEILVGTANYKKILELEEQRGQSLKQIFTKMAALFQAEGGTKAAQDHNNKNNKGRKRQLSYNANEFNRFLEESYLNAPTFVNSQYDKLFKELTPTIDNLMAAEINKAGNEIFQNRATLNLLKNATSANIKEIAKSLAKQISDIAIANMDLILDKYLYDQTKNITDDIIDKTVTNFDNNLPIEKNFGIFKEIIDENNKIYGENLSNKLLKLKKQFDEKKGKSQTIDPEAKNFFTSLLSKKAAKVLSADEEKALYDILTSIEDAIASKNNEQSVSNREIGNMKRQLTLRFKRDIQDYLQEKHQPRIIDDTKKQINKLLGNIGVNVTGSQFSEYIETQLVKGNFIEIFWSGATNHKADVMSFIIDWPNMPDIEVNKLDNFSKKVLAGASQDFMRTFDQLIDVNEKGNQERGFSLARGAAAFSHAAELVTDNIQAFMTTFDEYLDNLTSAAEIIRNSISVTSTMKTYNDYNPDIGFVAGSMGPNLMAQIDNFNTLFTAAGSGLTPDEIEWLEVALVNCSAAAMGYYLKNPLERYLSVLAGFAIFDEGSFEVQEIANKMDAEDTYQQTTPSIMHLYRLNGLYFPGSYILQRIYEKLNNTFSEMHQQTKITDGVHIRATANETIIDRNSPEGSIERWYTTYERALRPSVTSIKVTFLSNLLDVVNQLNAAFTI